jgi:hypothetical protein
MSRVVNLSNKWAKEEETAKKSIHRLRRLRRSESIEQILYCSNVDPHSTLATPLNYRTVSGPGSPARQPRWGGGSDRMLHSTGGSLEEVMSEQDLTPLPMFV